MSEGIAYQNKDILFKILGQTYKEKKLCGIRNQSPAYPGTASDQPAENLSK